MLEHLLLISLPLLSCYATYLDPSLQQQMPLVQGSLPATPSDPTILPLSLNEDLSYTFPSTHHHHHKHPTPLHRLQNTAAIHATHHEHDTITLSIPLSASQPGTVSFSTTGSASLASPDPRLVTWVPQNPWDTAMRYMPLLDAGLRKGGLLSMAASFGTLDLSTPFIALPKALWDVVVLATEPVKVAAEDNEADEGVWRVECTATNRLPDLVLGMLVQDGDEKEEEEEEEAETEEFVVTPEQYVLRRGGECLLLVREMEAEAGERGDISLGWAAVRGRDVVFDWERGRIGFGEVKK